MKKQTILFTICLATIFATACNKEKKETVEPLTECTDFSLPNDYVPEMIQEVEETDQVYVMGYNENATDYETMYQLFRFDKEKTGYKEPQEITIDETYFVQNMTISNDGKQAYFSCYLTDEISEGEYEKASYHMYKGDIKENEIVNIEDIKDVNIKQVSSLADVDSKGNLYFASFDYDSFSTPYRAVKKENGYELEELSLSEDVEYSSIAFFLEEQKQAILGNRGSDNWLSEFYIADFSENKVEDVQILQMPKEIAKENVYFFSISTENNMCYMITVPDANQPQTRKIYKLSLSTLLENKKETADYENCSYDAYDSSDFEMKYRNKGNLKEKQGVYYEIFVRSFADSDGDGIGDLNGVTQKLDYLKELGVDGIWLMPIQPSPSYHGYDVTDYNAINPEYGTKKDFELLLKEAHKRNIKVIMDYVINHTSSEHPWFQNAISDENSEYRNYYRWVKPEDKTDYSAFDESDMGYGVWCKAGTDYYYGIFASDMPDLNYNNPKVRKEIIKSAQNWLKLGVDGFRLDAARHIYGDCEFKQQKDPLEANLQWWNEFAIACEEINPDVYLVGEAWKEAETLPEYAQPFDTKFNFTFQSDLVAALQNEKAEAVSSKTSLAKSLEDILEEYATYDKNFIDGMFISNHDQDRILSQVKTEEKAKLAANIYLTLPGNPFIYYGEEIGMKGQTPDENIREPFKWSKDGNDLDTTWEEDAFNQDTMPLEKQQASSADTMYHHYKELITLRKSHKALTEGSYRAVDMKNKAIFAYLREYKEEKLLIIHNLSHEKTTLEKDLFTGKDILYRTNANDTLKKNTLHLSGYATAVIKLKSQEK